MLPWLNGPWDSVMRWENGKEIVFSPQYSSRALSPSLQLSVFVERLQRGQLVVERTVGEGGGWQLCVSEEAAYIVYFHTFTWIAPESSYRLMCEHLALYKLIEWLICAVDLKSGVNTTLQDALNRQGLLMLGCGIRSGHMLVIHSLLLSQILLILLCKTPSTPNFKSTIMWIIVQLRWDY